MKQTPSELGIHKAVKIEHDRSTQPSIPPGLVNRVPAYLALVKAGEVCSLVSGGR